MIIYPYIEQLLEKVPTRYTLAVLAAQRAHELEAGDLKMLSDYKTDKSVGQALEEIAAGDVIIELKYKMLERDAEKLELQD